MVQDHTPLSQRPATSQILLQEHGHPVFFRNIWMVDGKGDYDFFATAGIGLRRLRPSLLSEARSRQGSAPFLVHGRLGFPGTEAVFGVSGALLRP
jgi:hypothetical protein